MLASCYNFVIITATHATTSIWAPSLLLYSTLKHTSASVVYIYIYMKSHSITTLNLGSLTSSALIYSYLKHLY